MNRFNPYHRHSPHTCNAARTRRLRQYISFPPQMAAYLARGTLLYLSTVNLGTAVLFAYDKTQANRGGWRVSEFHLCQTALLGGWPGGLAAMQLFRHKTQKTSFQKKYVSALVTNASFMVPALAIMFCNTSYRGHFAHALRQVGEAFGRNKGGGRKPPRYRR